MDRLTIALVRDGEDTLFGCFTAPQAPAVGDVVKFGGHRYRVASRAWNDHGREAWLTVEEAPPPPPPDGSPEERIAKALDLAAQCGGVDGAHHKAWAIDQMVRALTGCPTVTETKTGIVSGNPYTYERQGESDEYRAWVEAYEERDEHGDRLYVWDTGTPP